MTNPAKSSHNDNAEVSAELLKPAESKTEKELDFFDLKEIIGLSPAVEEIYLKLDPTGKDRRQIYEEVNNLVAKEITRAKGEKLEQLQEFQTRVEKLLDEMEENEFTYSRAHQIFENAAINAVNNDLAEEKKIISSDGVVGLKWFVDEEMPEGHFALVQHLERKPYTDEDEPGEMITLRDEKTGEEYTERKLSGAVKSQKDMARFYYLKPEQAKEIFNKLEPAVKKSILDGLKDQIKENKRYAENLKDKMEKEKNPDKKEDLKNQIAEEDLAREKINKNLKALD